LLNGNSIKPYNLNRNSSNNKSYIFFKNILSLAFGNLEWRHFQISRSCSPGWC